MSFDVVKLRGCDVGGLVVPGIGTGDSDLLRFTYERMDARGFTEIYIVFVRDDEIGWAAVVGYPCSGPDDLAVGDSLVRVRPGYAACFVPDGDGDNSLLDLWRQVECAEREGSIERAFREELAVVGSGPTKLFVSLT